jgi:hypothetical protein
MKLASYKKIIFFLQFWHVGMKDAVRQGMIDAPLVHRMETETFKGKESVMRNGKQVSECLSPDERGSDFACLLTGKEIE